MHKRVHFISIGGNVMHALAIVLKGQGWEVSGSDDEIYSPSADALTRADLLPEKIGLVSFSD